MITTIFQTILLAEQQPVDFRAMGQHFRADSAHLNVSHMFVLALAVLVIASLIWALTRWQENEIRWNQDNPQKLFNDLCKKHELNANDTTLLRRVVRELQLTHPASLFVDPSLLVSAMRLEKFQELHTELVKLGEEFFGFHLWKQAVASDRSQLHELRSTS